MASGRWCGPTDPRSTNPGPPDADPVPVPVPDPVPVPAVSGRCRRDGEPPGTIAAVEISVWFDPACPYCWMTSRWLVAVAPERGLEIDWQPISLLLKNCPEPDDPRVGTWAASHRTLRVVEAVREAGHADRIGDLYTAFGRLMLHEEQIEVDIAAVLSELGLDPALATAADDDRYDEAIQASMEAAFALTGTDVGTPLIALTDTDGERVGIFGPVITRFPEGDSGLRLWDGIVAVTCTPGFFELKRGRTGGPELPPLP